jgi:hypothetical protein
MRPIATCVWIITVIAISSPVFAQDAPTANVSFGYQWQRASASDCEGDGCSESLPAGWYVDVAGGISPMFGWVGQVDGSYKSNAFDDSDLKFNLHTYGGGVRFSGAARVNPFVQFLLGGMRTKFSELDFDEPAENAFMIDIGGGVTIPAGTRWGTRVGVDYRRGFFKEEDGGAVNTVRVNVGVVVNLN